MIITLFFDSDRLENCYRQYTLDNDEDLRNGKMVKIAFCHPDHGEQMMSKTCEMLSEESVK